MAIHFDGGHATLKKLCDALGLTGPICRVVIDCPVDGLAKVYVQRLVETPRLEAAAAVLADAPTAVVDAQEIRIDKEGNVRASCPTPR